MPSQFPFSTHHVITGRVELCLPIFKRKFFRSLPLSLFLSLSLSLSLSHPPQFNAWNFRLTDQECNFILLLVDELFPLLDPDRPILFYPVDFPIAVGGKKDNCALNYFFLYLYSFSSGEIGLSRRDAA